MTPECRSGLMHLLEWNRFCFISPLNWTKFLGKVDSLICWVFPCLALENDTGYCGVCVQ